MTDEAREISPFGFVDFGNTTDFKDFVPQPVSADDDDADPKASSVPASAASPVQELTSSPEAPEADPVDVVTVPPPDLDPSELPKPTFSSPVKPGKPTPPVQAPLPTTDASPVNPATLPILSSPSEAKTTPPAK